MEKLQVHKRIRQIVTEHACHAGSLEKNDTVDYSLQIGKNGMLRVKMFETVDIGPLVILPAQNLLSDFAEGHTRQNRRSRNAPLPEYEVSYPNGN